MRFLKLTIEGSSEGTFVIEITDKVRLYPPGPYHIFTEVDGEPAREIANAVLNVIKLCATADVVARRVQGG